MRTSVEKITEFWSAHGDELVGSAGMAALLFPAVEQQLDGKSPADVDVALEQLAAWALSLRSDDAAPITIRSGENAPDPDAQPATTG
ncbi:MAG TPA: hypothetical protein VG348_15865 [Acidimicrobiia bacterium]|jgi:hypothetical protein|nr:hypothetical protein [Acidimicrobiia bacterium]